MDDRRYLIVAGTKDQAEDYRREHGLSRRNIIYATPQSLRGRSLDNRWTIVHVGTWRGRRDLLTLLEYIEICQAGTTARPARLYA